MFTDNWPPSKTEIVCYLIAGAVIVGLLILLAAS